MAEAVAAIGLVASIVQLVEFGHKVTRRLAEFQSSLGEVPRTFKDTHAILPVLLDSLERTKAAVDAGLTSKDTRAPLQVAIRGCLTQIVSLDSIITACLPLPGDSLAKRGKKAFSSLRQDAKLARIRDTLRDYVQALVFHHAAEAQSSSLKIGKTPSLPPVLPSSMVPFRRDPDFIERGALIQLQQMLSEPSARAALVGLGGVGKSQLAIEYCYRLQDRCPDIWVFWVHAGSVARFEESFRQIAKRVKPLGWDRPDADTLSLVAAWLSDEQSGRWSLVVDNADDSGTLSAPASSGASGTESPARSLSNLLPHTPNGKVLITSRNRDLASRLAGGNASLISVGPMEPSHALMLFDKKLSSSIARDKAPELMDALDYMPLAIGQAATYIAQRSPRITVSKYLDELCRGEKSRSKLLCKDLGDSRRDGAASNSVIATWQITFEHLCATTPSAARLLSLMSLFDRHAIPDSLLETRYCQAVDSEVDFEEDLYTLMSYSLISCNDDGTKFEMHRLVQFSTKEWLELKGTLDQWQETYMTLIDDAFPEAEFKDWTTCSTLLPHAHVVMNHRPKNKQRLDIWARFLLKVARYTFSVANLPISEELAKHAADAFRESDGRQPGRVISCWNCLAEVYRARGKDKEAKELALKTFAYCKGALANDVLATLPIVLTLGSLLIDLGLFQEAAGISEKIIDAVSIGLGPEHQVTLCEKATLAAIYKRLGRVKEAEEIVLQVYKIWREKLTEEHPQTLLSMSNVTDTYVEQRRWSEAETLLQRATPLSIRVFGADHPCTLSFKLQLAHIFLERKQLKEAEELCSAIWEVSEQRFGRENPATVASMFTLCRAYYEQRRYGEAAELYIQLLEARKRSHGDSSREVMNDKRNLAVIYRAQGRARQADDLLQEATADQSEFLAADVGDSLAELFKTFANAPVR